MRWMAGRFGDNGDFFSSNVSTVTAAGVALTVKRLIRQFRQNLAEQVFLAANKDPILCGYG